MLQVMTVADRALLFEVMEEEAYDVLAQGDVKRSKAITAEAKGMAAVVRLYCI